jgi:hypothetical protein
MISTEKLYYHWTTTITMFWGVAALLVIPMLAIWLKEANPTNYDTWIIIGLSIATSVVWMYNYMLDESSSNRSYNAGLKRIFENKDLSPEEISKRVDIYKRMF